jgi:hypothetical protein
MKYILKKREYLGKVTRAFGGSVGSYGPWETVAKLDTLEAARAAYTNRTGLYQVAVFLGGKNVEWLTR